MPVHTFASLCTVKLEQLCTLPYLDEALVEPKEPGRG
jgi:hypothetical protein